MEVIETIGGMRQARQWRKEPIGFVPTMGYLHEGHLSLVKRAKNENSNTCLNYHYPTKNKLIIFLRKL